MWKVPKFETSWDNGKTWQEQYSLSCGEGMLLRIVSENGEILWRGRGISVPKACLSCDGKGIRNEVEFAEEKPEGN